MNKLFFALIFSISFVHSNAFAEKLKTVTANGRQVVALTADPGERISIVGSKATITKTNGRAVALDCMGSCTVCNGSGPSCEIVDLWGLGYGCICNGCTSGTCWWQYSPTGGQK